MKTFKLFSLFVAVLFQTSTAQMIQTHEGWDLLGATETINDLSDFSEDCVRDIWLYEADTGWKTHSLASHTGTITSIEKGQGFWQRGIKECNVNVGAGQITNSWYQPGIDTTWQWQLSGEVNRNYDVDVYDIDLFDSETSLIDALHADNKKVICYFSAGSYEDWREDQGLFQSSDVGNALDGWEGERWLDIRSDNVKTIMKSRLDLARSKGCDGVEPDNVDGYQNSSGFLLTPKDQLVYNRFLAEESHSRGLAIGLKNDLDQVADLVGSFDFALNEECHEYDECDSLHPFIEAGKPVLIAEYADQYISNAGSRASLCEESNQNRHKTLVLPLELDDSFRYACWE